MTKKQIIKIAAAIAAVIALIIVYFAAVKPAIDRKSAVTEEKPHLLPGESLGTSDRFYMYDSMERSRIASVKVVNENGTFTLVKTDKDTFYVDGFEDVYVDEETVSYLVTTCGATLTKMRVAEDATPEQLEEYGLKNPIAYWILTDTSGKEYKVYVGRRLLTGGGYYCAFAGRGSVYVIDTAVEKCVLCPVEDYIVPYIVFGVSKDDYYSVDNFTVYKGREKFISIGQVAPDKQANPDAFVENVLTYPAPYTPDPELFFNILMSFTGLRGDSTYKLGATEETMKECGLDEPAYTVSYEYGGATFVFLVSEKDEDGYYYVISNMYGKIITKVSEKTLAYLEYGMMDWVYDYIFRRNIVTVSEIEVKTASVDETFYLTHGVGEDNVSTLQIRSDNGLIITDDERSRDFRHYYGDMLDLAVQDYLPDETPDGTPMKEFLKDESNRTMTLTFRLTNGEELKYEFYRFSAVRCAVGINGVFDFYVLSDTVKRVERDTVNIINGGEVEGRY